MSHLRHYAALHCEGISVKFDDFKAYRALARDPLTPRISGSSNTAIVSGELQVRADRTASGRMYNVEQLYRT